MNNFDPSEPSIINFTGIDQELTIEDIAQNQLEESSGEDAQIPAPAPIPAPGPIAPSLPKRAISGRYRYSGNVWQLELRIDVDGKRPMKRVSGDFFQVSGATVIYFGSFVVNAPSISVTSSTVTIEGVINATFNAAYPKIRVTVPRVSIAQPPAPATLRFFSQTNQPGAVYTCAFESVYFRTVQYEQDFVADVTKPVFTSYNTGALPSGGPARVLSVAGAYAEAGIELQTAGVWNEVPTADDGVNGSWSNAELHASMIQRFSLWKDAPQWKVWLLAAQKHDQGPGLYGIMFDQAGKQRQGCATFHQGLGGNTADKLRLQLYTYVHELGHCFNLLHSWQKSFAVPPVPNRPAALSFMNYPWNYPNGGSNAFWSAFPFQFDDQEVIHLRHAFRNNIIMGANNFAVGAGLQETQALNDPVIDNSRLQLEISSRRSFACGEPVVVELKLSTSDPRGKEVHTHLHPNTGLVQIGIRKPSGQVVAYEPLIEHCVAAGSSLLDKNRSNVEDSAYIGYGKGGFYFDQAGNYQIRAVYYAIDGSQVMSNVLNLRVRYPVTAAEEELADLFYGEEQGTLLYLLGSDAESLSRGNDAFETVIDKYGKNPMSTYARLVRGMNLGREFKTINSGGDREISVRSAQADESVKLLAAVVDTDEGESGLDPISHEMVVTQLARVQREHGDEKGAAATMKRIRKARGAGQ
ncbi:MAG TPA: hypothetical protein VJ302_24720 [Blastocatellia bacterium]|nr:hypothetical protein [Blastocatellia bacterium]